MKLSADFTFHEMIRSQTATRHAIDNMPGPKEMENLKALVSNILQPLRDMLQRPINISSGYRSPALNQRIGGSVNSQHVKGEAADIECFGVNNYALAKMIHDNFVYDQLILEFYYPEKEGPNRAGFTLHTNGRKKTGCRLYAQPAMMMEKQFIQRYNSDGPNYLIRWGTHAPASRCLNICRKIIRYLFILVCFNTIKN